MPHQAFHSTKAAYVIIALLWSQIPAAIASPSVRFAQNVPSANTPATGAPTTGTPATGTAASQPELPAIPSLPDLVGRKETPDNTPAKPLTEAEARAAFAQEDAKWMAAKAGTQERGTAAGAAMNLASTLGWLAFDKGRYDEASTWLTRSAALKKEQYENMREWTLATSTTAETQLLAVAKDWQDKLAKTTDPKLKSSLQSIVDGMPATIYAQRSIGLGSLEILAQNNEDLPGSLRYCQQELALHQSYLNELIQAKASPDKITQQKATIAKALEKVAYVQGDLAQFDEAKKNYTTALTMRRALPPDFPGRDEYETLSDLGLLYAYNIGDYTQARTYFQQSLDASTSAATLHQKMLDDQPFPKITGEKPDDEKKRYQEWQVTQAQLKQMQMANDALQRATILNNLGDMVLASGDYKGAMEFYQRALKVEDVLPPGPGYYGMVGIVRASMHARSLLGTSFVHAQTGDFDAATKEINEVIQLRRADGIDKGVGSALEQAAGFYYQKDDTATTKAYIEQARKIYLVSQNRFGIISTNSFLSTLALDADRLDEAARYAQEELSLARTMGNYSLISSAARDLMSVRLKQKRLDEAETLLKEADVANTHTGAIQNRISTLGWWGQLREAQGQNDVALKNYQQSIDLMENVRVTAASETGFSNVKQNYKRYERIVRLLIKMGRNEEAFQYLNRARSTELQQALRLSTIKTPDKALQAQIDRYAGLQQKLRSVDNQLNAEQAKPDTERDAGKIKQLQLVLADTQAQYFQVSDQLQEAARAANRDWGSSVTPEMLKDAQDRLPPDAILVQYVPLGDDFYVFLVTKDTLKVYAPKVKPDDLWANIREFRKLMDRAKRHAQAGDDLSVKDWMSDNADTSDLRKNLTGLYDMLIAPIEPELKSKQTVIFMPTQLLYYLPMQALAKVVNGKLKFFVEDKEIVYLAADNFTKVMVHDTSQLGTGLVAVGDPAGADLPQSLEEAKGIARVFPGTEVLTGTQATKSTLINDKNLSKRILHLATHGFLSAGQPTASYILLAKGATADDNGQLTLAEVQGLKLNKFDLVTLSACQTAVGERTPGLEVSSLAKSFSRAGAQTILASLWSVSDESTKRMMDEFYKQLAAKQSKGQALQSAELSLLKDPKYNHPFYWAPFNLMGDWR